MTEVTHGLIRYIKMKKIMKSYVYRKIFANALMQPQFDYLDTIYYRAGITKLIELEQLSRKVAKIALGVFQTLSSSNVYRDMKWLPYTSEGSYTYQLHVQNNERELPQQLYQ